MLLDVITFLPYVCRVASGFSLSLSLLYSPSLLFSSVLLCSFLLNQTVLFISSIECIPRAFKTCRMVFLPQKKTCGKPLFKTLGNYDAFPLFTWPCGLVLTQSYRSAEFLVMMFW